jgi:ribosomal-protein-alanine N-acetyltransferase
LVLEGKRLVLRESADDDAEALLDYHRRNRERFAPWEPLFADEIAAHRDWIAGQRAQRRTEGPVAFLSFDRATNALVGIVVVAGFSTIPPSAMVNYSVDGACEGQGYASEAVALVVDYAFDVLGLESLMAFYDPKNLRSGALLERLGFRFAFQNPSIPGFERLMRVQNAVVLTRVDRKA